MRAYVRRAGQTARLVIVAGITVIMLLMAVRPAVAQPGSLRSVDWRAVLESHPLIEIQRDLPPPWDSFGPYVIIREGALPDAGEVTGHARLDGILYGDLDSDGNEEAVIPLDSGGTAGATGWLLFRATSAGPSLVLARNGYKLGFELRDGLLIINQPVYVGFEANCCPSGWETWGVSLSGSTLVERSYVTGGYPQARALTVEAFYHALNERQYEDAYEFLSPEFQAAHPFAEWAAGYASTQRINVQAENGPGADQVTVQLTATDRTAGGAQAVSHFAGSWFLSWSGTRWLLERADIRPL